MKVKLYVYFINSHEIRDLFVIFVIEFNKDATYKNVFGVYWTKIYYMGVLGSFR